MKTDDITIGDEYGVRIRHTRAARCRVLATRVARTTNLGSPFGRPNQRRDGIRVMPLETSGTIPRETTVSPADVIGPWGEVGPLRDAEDLRIAEEEDRYLRIIRAFTTRGLSVGPKGDVMKYGPGRYLIKQSALMQLLWPEDFQDQIREKSGA